MATRPTLSDGTGVNHRSLVEFCRRAAATLAEDGAGDGAYYFEMLEEFLVKDVANGKPFVFSSKVFGL